MKLSLEAKLRSTRNFVSIYLERARDLAKEGRKGEARDWLRFFRNSGLVDILADDEVGVLAPREEDWMREQIRLLESECHPLDVPNFSTDLQAIRGHLEALSAHLGLRLATVSKIQPVECCITP